MCANIFFRALYVPAMLFPKVKWLGLPPALLGMTQALAHGGMSVRTASDKSLADKNSPYAFTARQIGPCNPQTTEDASDGPAAEPDANG